MKQNEDWIDPYTNSDKMILRPEVSQVRAHAAVKGKTQHKIMTFEAIQDRHLDAEGGPWELFSISLMGTIDGQKYYWGMFVLGGGFINAMVQAENARPLTARERAAWSKQGLNMVGSHTGKLAYSMPSGVPAEDEPLP